MTKDVEFNVGKFEKKFAEFASEEKNKTDIGGVLKLMRQEISVDEKDMADLLCEKYDKNQSVRWERDAPLSIKDVSANYIKNIENGQKATTLRLLNLYNQLLGVDSKSELFRDIYKVFDGAQKERGAGAGAGFSR